MFSLTYKFHFRNYAQIIVNYQEKHLLYFNKNYIFAPLIQIRLWLHTIKEDINLRLKRSRKW